MTQQNIVIVDTGCANISSVLYAVERLGDQVTVSDSPQVISQADKVILPGVGSAKHAMKNIEDKGLVETIQSLTQPVLGFCLGMQLMCAESAESGFNNENEQVACLGLVPTTINVMKADGLRLPHMGWNTLTFEGNHPIFKGIESGAYVYFVHSYCAPISQYTIASCTYGQPFSAAIAKDNFIGCQFHPERSSDIGSLIIKNFLEM
ncbi:imidazole glycerol phosphate synthase subunit HisH [Thalassotalea eurytherma]|uniref:Imidazole glycerol phosphate synthase subunit HisH n=1 Tax=Thalassotalea eurytherma TaxID=1144278 RepID=A0ABQ6H285_9GAMM|nr:imidazole glycerol phosphate synthase subunit HisH [Thalassotalea eurytherma]GLX80927.1 imidazole glycerol phosphate synthase subunit HisH [Thalassotalea eurytherma]